MLVVPQGTVVLQAANPTAGQQTTFDSPSAQFFVLKDNVSLFGNDITNPQQSTDQAGSPTSRSASPRTGQNEFQNVTATIAQRGELVSGLGQSSTSTSRSRSTTS